jgi:hypothetical protein
VRCRNVRRILAENVEEAVDFRPGVVDDHLVDDHLKACSACSAFHTQMKMAWKSLEAYPSVEPSPGFADTFYARLKASSETREHPGLSWWPQRGWQWMTLAACSMMVAFLLTVHTPQNQSNSILVSKTDSWDDQFLRDLDSSMSHWESNYLPVYDSWPNSLLDPSFQESPQPQ